MSKPGQLSRPVSLGATLLALVLGFAVGHHLGAQPDAAAKPASVGPDTAKRYRIPVSTSQPSWGPVDALVTIVQWCDLPDAGCRAIEPAVESLRKRHGNELRLVFRHYARPSQASALGHKFARVVHEQAGKFWEARRLLLEHTGELTRADVERYTAQLELDWPAVRAALDGSQQAGHITADRLFADMFDVRDAPAFFVNGRPLAGTPTLQSLESLVVEELARAKQLVSQGVPKDGVYAQLTKNGAWNPKVAAR